MLGIYDSGIGGITVYNEIGKLLPKIDVMYLADQAVLPLGEKSVDQIRSRLTKACQILFKKGCNIVVLACNTATVTSIRYLQSQWLPQNFPNKQILGISKPFTEFINNKYFLNKDIQGLILSTPATHKSKFYVHELSSLGFTNFTSQPCVGLAQTIELQDNKQVFELLKIFILQNITSKVIFLACTHYPICIDIIQKVISDFDLNMEVVDHTNFIAQRTAWYLSKHGEFEVSKLGRRLWLCSGKVETFTKQVKDIFGIDVEPEYVEF